MQTLSVVDDCAVAIGASLHEETDGLDAMHRGLMQKVTAWRSAHDAAVRNTSTVLGRIDALIAAIERL